MKRLSSFTPRRCKGFSILELLIAVIIIGILAAILIPLISNRTQQARIASAESDLERIGTALSQLAIDTGYYSRIFLLNDISGAAAATPLDNPDGIIFDNTQGLTVTGNYFQNISNNLFILAEGENVGQFVPPNRNSNLIDLLQTDETEFNWNGPYINWQKDNNAYAAWPSASPDGLPDDPWGNNYLLFTREGLVLEPEGEIVTSTTFPLDNANINGGSVNCQVFDRLTILSLGPDGAPGSAAEPGLGRGDDIVRQFGR
ncbi:MAG: prepilin-type N-terminal cleavage/methylation domain-containing protein [Candidatus Sumerlaeia bacterium]|nr:prepilin-type N-terminal cleavage/methylation domain-containing protein [Candidatus Sumerlaeia bacterium]